ncbi:MAG: glycosyltransferase [Mogibacterium sp.]|nr:glycosyltransferase [Mogibacterium sp.]
MRVLEAFGEPFSYGGQEAFVMNVLGKMDRKGIEADFLTPYYCDNEIAASIIRSQGGDIYALGCDFRPGKLRNSATKPIRNFLKTHHYDVIHIHSGSNSMLEMYARLAHQAGIPHIIVHSHCTGKHGLKHFASKALTSFGLRLYPDEYCACSREAGLWRFPADICKKRLKVINNGIDIERFRFNGGKRTEMRRKLGLTEDTFVLVNVGRLTYQKNQSFLLDLLHSLQSGSVSGGTKKYKLILVGDGEDRDMLLAKAGELGLLDELIMTGAVHDPENYLQAADLALMPSRYEGLAISVIEAQASGLEVLAADVIPALAAAADGVTFLSIDDPDAWAEEVIQEHVRHPEQADRLLKNGFGIEHIASGIRELYLQTAQTDRDQ